MLSLIDLRRDPPKRGNWAEADGLHYAAELGVVGFVPLPLTIHGSYEFKMELTAWGTGLGPLLVMPVSTSWVRLMLDGGRAPAHLSGLERVKGLMITAPDNPTATSFQFELGKKHLLEMSVHVKDSNADIDARIDGQKLFTWQGPTSELSLASAGQGLGAPELGILGLRPFSMYSFKLKSLDNGVVQLSRSLPAKGNSPAS